MATFNSNITDRSIEHAVDLLRVSNTQSAAIKKILSTLQRKIVGLVAQANIVQGNSVNSGKTQALIRAVNKLIDEYYQRIQVAMGTATSSIVSSEQTLQQSLFTIKGQGAPLLKNIFSKQQVKDFYGTMLIAGALSSEWWERQSTDLAQKFADSVKSAASDATNLDDAVRGTPDAGFKDSIFQASNADADALVKTTLASASNDARMQLYAANSDLFAGYQQISVLDNRTSNICIAYSGATWDKDFNPMEGGLPFNGGTPRHWRCRSIIVPIVLSWEQLGIDGEDVPDSVRSSMDGTVPADTTYEDWLKGKSVSMQNEILGTGIANLWRSGQISLQDLVNASGSQAMTLSDLKAKVSQGNS